ncbi:MAG: hypothetical protein M3R02_26835 [Chloroflexota bacterium]|nr:hypothetical protein [Chloroflexota bacterium]
MARIEVNTLVVVRRVVMELDGQSVQTRPREVVRRSGGPLSNILGALPSWLMTERPGRGRRGIAAGALLALAAVALGDITRRRSNLPALPVPPLVKALPSSTRRSLPVLADALSQPEP